MAYVRLTYNSAAIGGEENVSVFLPANFPQVPGQRARKIDAYDKKEKYQVLWLMHGGGDDHSAWALDAMIQRACDGSFSGALNIPNEFAKSGKDGVIPVSHIFGDKDKIVGSDNDVYALAKRLAESGKPLPKVYLSCGTEDSLYSASTEMRQLMEKAGYDVTWDEAPCGHVWPFWNKQIEKFLNMI